jgi:hypothetical protein
MKYIIPILLMLSSTCFGQSVDSADRDWVPLTDTLGHDSTFDTIKVMMLVCDTTYKTNLPPDAVTYSDNWTSYNHRVQWSYGYEVNVPPKEQYFEYLPKQYLDIKRKPLHKNIVVWQVIKLPYEPELIYYEGSRSISGVSGQGRTGH